MDPNETLAELRAVIDEVRNAHLFPAKNLDDQMDRMVELCRALDTWLSRGGFLPIAWQKLRGS